MEWRDQGVVLAVRRHGETAAIVEIFCAKHGRHLGVVRGGAGRRMAPILQPGAQLDVTWRARLSEHLGAFTIEPVKSRAAAVLDDPLALAGLNAVMSLAAFALPERQPEVRFYAQTQEVLAALVAGAGWLPLYLHWEMSLLATTGFGLDLSSCAVTGVSEGLAYVSPRSGRAVSQAGAGNWVDRLLPLPTGVLEDRPMSARDVSEGLALTGYFLIHKLAPALGERPLPPARQRLLDRIGPQSRAGKRSVSPAS